MTEEKIEEVKKDIEVLKKNYHDTLRAYSSIVEKMEMLNQAFESSRRTNGFEFADKVIEMFKAIKESNEVHRD